MSRRMSCAMTVDQVRNRTKSETRRHVDSWAHLNAGDRLTLVEKAMGLPKGATQVVLAHVEVVSVDVEPLDAITSTGCAAEGFPAMTPADFVAFWLSGHGYPPEARPLVRVIRWQYLDETEETGS